jgi:hypothetical protein
MKNYPFVVFNLLTFLAISFFSRAQESYEFEKILPPNAKEVNMIDIRYVGQYKNEQTGTIFQFDMEGITMITTIYSFITREQIRESSKFSVRNGYLHGMVKNDSLPCYLENDKYYFGIKQQEVLIGKGSPHKLTKIDDRHYIINFKESYGYVPTLLTLKSNKITLQHFTYPSGTVLFDVIKNKKLIDGAAGTATIVISPSETEWKSLNRDLIFDAELEYVLLK